MGEVPAPRAFQNRLDQVKAPLHDPNSLKYPLVAAEKFR
jgi:hypothetical protein